MTRAGEIRSADPFLGQVVDGRYHVEAQLGVGSVGSVYRAIDRSTGKTVALKVWNSAADDPQIKGRFLREAQALTTLRHPNIVDVYGFGVVEELPYVAMEYVEGRTLEQELGEGQPLEATTALEIMIQILQALAYAHGLGVVHRDLKPDNVALISAAKGYVVKLLDFGLAKFLSPDDDPMRGSVLTLLGMVMGTPLYMAPEQADGITVDARVDVYAAGCVYFELLTGRPPYAGDTNAEVFRAHMVAPIPKLAELRPDKLVPPEVQQWIDKALAKLPEHRFADAGEMLEQLLTLPRPPLRPRTVLPDNDQRASAAPIQGAIRAQAGLPLIAALVAAIVTAAALAYALLR